MPARLADRARIESCDRGPERACTTVTEPMGAVPGLRCRQRHPPRRWREIVARSGAAREVRKRYLSITGRRAEGFHPRRRARGSTARSRLSDGPGDLWDHWRAYTFA